MGQGIGRRPRLDQAGRLRHALSRSPRDPEVALPRARIRRRDGGQAPLLHVRSQSARRLDRHAAACVRALRACRSHASRRGDRHRRRRKLPGADPADFRRRDRLAALAAPGVRARPRARTSGARKPASQRRGARRPRPVHLGSHRARLLPYDAAGHQSRRRMARRQRQDAGLRRRTHAEPVASAAARGGLPADAGDPLAHFIQRAQDRSFHRRPGGARVRQFARSRNPRAARHQLPRSFPAHQDLAADRAGGRRRCDARQTRRRLSRRLRRLLPTLPPSRLAGDARSQRRHLPRPRRRHDLVRQGHGDGAHRRRILRQRDQRDARGERRRPLRRPRRTGSLQHRILAARGSQAPAHAEAARHAGSCCAGDRRRRRHRLGDRSPHAGRRRVRRHRRHRRRQLRSHGRGAFVGLRQGRRPRRHA